jgi:hypothetical protein
MSLLKSRSTGRHDSSEGGGENFLNRVHSRRQQGEVGRQPHQGLPVDSDSHLMTLEYHESMFKILFVAVGEFSHLVLPEEITANGSDLDGDGAYHQAYLSLHSFSVATLCLWFSKAMSSILFWSRVVVVMLPLSSRMSSHSSSLWEVFTTGVRAPLSLAVCSCDHSNHTVIMSSQSFFNNMQEVTEVSWKVSAKLPRFHQAVCPMVDGCAARIS